MSRYINNCICTLETFMQNSLQKVEIVIIEDEKGIGKTTLIETYLITMNKTNIFFLKNGINQISLDNLYQQMLNNKLMDYYDERVCEIPFSSFVLQKLLDFSLFGTKYICFDGLDLYSNEAINFFFDFITSLINRKNIGDGRTIVFVLVDGKLNRKTKELISNFSRYVQYFKMPFWNNRDFVDLLQVNYGTMHILDESIEMIAKYSFGNAGIFLNTIDYLKMKGVIYKGGGIWKCHSFPENILLSNFQTSISERYNLLDDALKIVLKKASIVGFEFSFNVLEKPLHVQLANKALNEIESISRLINEKINAYNTYQFKSIETKISIESMVEPENTQLWSNLLGDYYIAEIKVDMYKSDMLSLCEKLLRATLYYKKGENFETALSCCMHLIPLLISQFRFYQALDVIKIAETINASDTIIKIGLIKFKYICSMGVFDFEEAYSAINKYSLAVKPKFSEEIYLNSLRAYALYNKGLTRKAYVLAKENYEQLKNLYYLDNDHLDTLSSFEKKVFVNSIAILTALEQTLGIRGFIKHFNVVLSFAKEQGLVHEYYSLLRRCNIAHRDIAAVDLLCEAKAYFENRNQTEYAMSCYNLATEYVYLNMPNEAKENICIANDIFIQLNHAGIVCVQIEKALLISIFGGQYELAWDIMKNRSVRYNEDFVELVYNFNMATISRKLGMLQEAKDFIHITEQINEKDENKLPYFEKLIFAQKGYIMLLEGDTGSACSYFEMFLRHDFAVKHEIILSIACSYNNISKVVSEDIKKMTNSENSISEILHKNQLVFAELSFWEL